MEIMGKTRQASRFGLLSAALGGAWLTGCASSVVVETEFPTPLVEPLPVRVGLMFSEELRDFLHYEEIPQQSAWTIDLGDANIAMLEPLFESMFEQTFEVQAMPLGPAQRGNLDGVLRASLNKFEFDVPIGDDDKFVEVWMQYQLNLYEPGGDLVAEWQVSGYGKAEMGGRKADSVNRAAVVAMREVGATISTKFAEQPQVGFWLQERQDAALVNN